MCLKPGGKIGNVNYLGSGDNIDIPRVEWGVGMGFWGVPMGLIFGLLGDLILKSGDYKSAKKSILGYAVFSLWMVGTYIPMYFMVEDSWASFNDAPFVSSKRLLSLAVREIL